MYAISLRLGNRWGVRRTCAIATMATGPGNRAHNTRENVPDFVIRGNERTLNSGTNLAKPVDLTTNKVSSEKARVCGHLTRAPASSDV